MAPSPIPAPLPPWARALVQVAPFIPAGLQNVLEYIGIFEPVDSGQPDAWMQVQLVGQPLDSTERADDFITTMDIVNITNGAVDSSWTQADFDAVSGHLNTICASWATRMSYSYRWREQRFYRRSFNPYTLDTPFAKSGPPEIIYPMNFPGTSVNEQAPQVALTSTERTAYPGHWGRNYWPHPGAALCTDNGYVLSSAVDSWALTLFNELQLMAAAEYFIVVPTTQYTVGDVVYPARGLLTVSEIQVDNLFDITRSRRPKKSTYKRVYPALAQALPASG